jgi:hypothetical protein
VSPSGPDDLPPFVYVPCELEPVEVETMMPLTRTLASGGAGLVLYTALDRLRRAQGHDRAWAVLDLPTLGRLQALRRYDAFLVDDGLDASERAHG